jgi:hypothetical protein
VIGMQMSACYEIRVAGVLDASWSAWFEGLAVTSDRQLGPRWDCAGGDGHVQRV